MNADLELEVGQIRTEKPTPQRLDFSHTSHEKRSHLLTEPIKNCEVQELQDTQSLSSSSDGGIHSDEGGAEKVLSSAISMSRNHIEPNDAPDATITLESQTSQGNDRNDNFDFLEQAFKQMITKPISPSNLAF